MSLFNSSCEGEAEQAVNPSVISKKNTLVITRYLHKTVTIRLLFLFLSKQVNSLNVLVLLSVSY